jgi:hypothetical protein
VYISEILSGSFAAANKQNEGLFFKTLCPRGIILIRSHFPYLSARQLANLHPARPQIHLSYMLLQLFFLAAPLLPLSTGELFTINPTSVLSFPSSNHSYLSTLPGLFLVYQYTQSGNDPPPPYGSVPAFLYPNDGIWVKAVCAGRRLIGAMTAKKDQANRFLTPVGAASLALIQSKARRC